MATTAELALERDRIEERLARNEHDPHARLAEIDAELERQHAELERARQLERERSDKICPKYVEAQQEALAAMRDLVTKVNRAVELRREVAKVGKPPERVGVTVGRRGHEWLSQLLADAAIAVRRRDW